MMMLPANRGGGSLGLYLLIFFFFMILSWSLVRFYGKTSGNQGDESAAVVVFCISLFSIAFPLKHLRPKRGRGWVNGWMGGDGALDPIQKWP